MDISARYQGDFIVDPLWRNCYVVGPQPPRVVSLINRGVPGSHLELAIIHWGNRGSDLRISHSRFIRVLRVSMLLGGAARGPGAILAFGQSHDGGKEVTSARGSASHCGGERKGTRRRGSLVLGGTSFIFLPKRPSHEWLGYCLSPSGLGWPWLSAFYPLRAFAASAVKNRLSVVGRRSEIYANLHRPSPSGLRRTRASTVARRYNGFRRPSLTCFLP